MLGTAAAATYFSRLASMYRQFFKPKYLVGATVGCGLVYAGSTQTNKFVPYDSGARRSFHFWANVFPIYLHYRFYQLLNRDLHVLGDEYADKKYLELHELYTDRVRDLTYSLRGFYLKNAQLMSVQEGVVPAAYMKWMRDTQDNVPTSFPGDTAKEYVRTKLKEELDVDFDDLFSSWDDTPLGVASIGQVHKAVLRRTGEAVAVKLLIPGMEQIFRADIRTLRSFCELAMPQHVSGFNEIEKQFATEFDYRLEATNLKLLRDAITPKWGRQFVIPRPHLQLCSKHILIMEYLEGERLIDGVMREFDKIARLTGRTRDDLREEYLRRMRDGTFQFKTIEQSGWDHWRLQWLLFAKDCLTTTNVLRLAYNNSPLVWLGGGPLPCTWSEVPLDLGRILESLCLVHGSQIFEHGMFNGDPHPGNILLLKDGRMGLIDYGQVKHFTLQQRISFAKMILALRRDDRAEVVRLRFEDMGVVTKHRNPEVAYRLTAFYNDRDTDDVLGGMNIVDFVDAMEKADPMIQLPQEYIFASRVSVIMRGLGRAFGLHLRMSHMWEGEARRFLKSQNIDY